MSQINITVREFASLYSDIIGAKPDTQCAIDLINQARIIAYPTGDWVGTIGYEIIPSLQGRFLLGSQYDAIREARYSCSSTLIHVHTGPITPHDYSSCCGQIMLTKFYGRAYSPLQLTENSPLKVSGTNSKDNGTNVRFQYIDSSGTHRDEEGPLSNKSCFILKYPVRSIVSISKPRTVGRVRIQSGSNYAFIEPKDTRPVFSIYCAQLDACSGPVYVKAKKRCQLYTLDDLDDVLDINPEALSSFMMAAKFKSKMEANWSNDYASSVKFGIDLLKKEYQNEDNTSIGTHPVAIEERFYDSIIPMPYGNEYGVWSG